MKKILFTILFAFCLVSLYAQADMTAQKSKSVVKDKVMPYQMGSGQTDKGVFTIDLYPPVESDYTVTITPLSNGASLYLAEHTKEKAVIKSSDGSAVPFQYVLFVKRPMQQAEPQPQHSQQPQK